MLPASYAREPSASSKLRRDIQAASFHPFPKPRQFELTGRAALGLNPVG